MNRDITIMWVFRGFHGELAVWISGYTMLSSLPFILMAWVTDNTPWFTISLLSLSF